MKPNSLIYKIPLVLCSASPRRKWILETAGYDVQQKSVPLDETLIADRSVTDALMELSRRKLEAVRQSEPKAGLASGCGEHWFVAADTEVVFQNRTLGKAATIDDAEHILRRLSGREHEVITAVSFSNFEQEVPDSFFCKTSIRFRVLSDREINRYLQSNEWVDKAGAYAIQGLGGSFVAEMKGDFLNVVGFPLCEFELKFLNLRGDFLV